MAPLTKPLTREILANFISTKLKTTLNYLYWEGNYLKEYPLAKLDSYFWFGHTTSLTPHLVPNCEVKSGQAASSTTLGDHAGTSSAERFIIFMV